MHNKFFLFVVLSVMTVRLKGQDMTYNHDAAVMNQFTVGEVGSGRLWPDWYYDILHKKYRNSALATNKQLSRTEMGLALVKQEPYAEALDSALNERMRVELTNIADRTPALDMAWMVEKGKVEEKLSVLKSFIERITIEGGSVQSYNEWLTRYNAIYSGIQAVRDAYMPQGSRKEQYIAIYKDILVRNAEVCGYLDYLRAIKDTKNTNNASGSVQKNDFAKIARSAHGRWKVAISGGSGVAETE